MLPYADEFAWIVEKNPILWYFFIAFLIFFITWVPFMGSSVFLVIFSTKKLPPFKKALYGYADIWWRFMTLILVCSTAAYTMNRWEGSAEAILAIAIVVLPISILYVKKDDPHTGLIAKLFFAGVHITVLVYVFWQFPEFRIGCGLYAYFAASLAILYYITSKWRKKEFKHPKAILISAIGAILLAPFIVVTVWVSNTIPSWEWPEWYKLLIYPEITLLAMVFFPWLYVEFWEPIRENIRGY